MDPETVISRNPSPSDEGTNSGLDFEVVVVRSFDGVVVCRVDGDDVNQLNVVIGRSVVVVVSVVVEVVVVVVVKKESSMKDDRSSMLSSGSSG